MAKVSWNKTWSLKMRKKSREKGQEQKQEEVRPCLWHSQAAAVVTAAILEMHLRSTRPVLPVTSIQAAEHPI